MPNYAQAFVDYNDIRGWKVGRHKYQMQSWRKAVNVWHRNEQKYAQEQAGRNPLPTRPELKPAPQPTVSMLPLEAMDAPRTFKGQSVEQELLALGLPRPADIPTEKK